MHDMDEMMGQMGMMGGGTVTWAWMALVVVVVAATLMMVSELAVRAAGRRRVALAPGTPSTAGDEALRILRQRYARSEIDEDEYHHRRDELA